MQTACYSLISYFSFSMHFDCLCVSSTPCLTLSDLCLFLTVFLFHVLVSALLWTLYEKRWLDVEVTLRARAVRGRADCVLSL